MEVRYADFDDLDIIAKNNVLLAKESEDINLNFDIVFKGVKSVISDRSKGFYLVAVEDDIIIGQLMITYEWSDWNNKFIWWIQSVYVSKSFRRKGVFTKLLNFLKKIAKEQDIKIIRLYVYNKNLDAQLTYESLSLIKKPYKIYSLVLN